MNENGSVSNDHRTAADLERGAAAWFVTLDAGAADGDTDREFAEWIDDDIGREAEFARCAAAMALADRLRADPEMRWAYQEVEALHAGAAPARRRASPGRWVGSRPALVAAGAVTVLVLLGASVFSFLRTESFPVVNQVRPDLLGDSPASEDDGLEREAVLPNAGARPGGLQELLEAVESGRPPAHFDRFPLDALVVRVVVRVQEPTSPRSRLLVLMPDGTVGDARVGDYLGQEDVRITAITTTAVLLEDGTRIPHDPSGAE